MAKLTFVADIVAKPGQAELVRAELEKLVPITRAKKGCIQFDLHRDNTNPGHFLFYENWESPESWQAHMGAPHLAAYMLATKGAVAEFVVNELTQIA